MIITPFSGLPPRVALLGFGEAGQAFAGAGMTATEVSAFDIKIDDPAFAPTTEASYARAGVRGARTLAEALAGVDVVLSLVTADRALEAACSAAGALPRDALFCDCNSVAPDTKRAAAAAIEAAGGRYVDVAVMAPVHPALLATPLLVSSPHAAEGIAALEALGFRPRAVAGDVGTASAIKMIRSVMVKGIEALTAECVLAASAAGVRDEVLASLDASWPGWDWTARADYNLDRMLVHGVRRAAEMDEAAKTVDAVGTGGIMARATAERQRALGGLGVRPPAGLDAKVRLILSAKRSEAA